MMDGGFPITPDLLPRLPYREPEEARSRSPRWVAMSFWLIFVAIWAGIAFLQVVSGAAPAEIMQWVGEQSTLIQVGLWIGFLPIMTAMAVWESSLDLWIRVIVLVACLVWTSYGLYPRRPEQ